MSDRERLVDGSESASDTDDQSTFLDGIEFLTGKDPNLGSFLLTVGIVTAVFIALFQFTLPSPFSHLLTGGVVFVTAVSAAFAAALESLGYFDRDSAPTATIESGERRAAARPWVPAEQSSAPLPPVINFDAELRAYADMYDGELPAEFGPFIDEYLRLKTNTQSRSSIASDLRADLNPIGTLFKDGSKGDRLYQDISDRLNRYISTKSTHVTVDRVTFYDEDGTETAVRDLNNRQGRVTFDVSNEGEAAEVDVVVELYNETGSAIASRTCEVGLISPGATKTQSTDVFVPSDAATASTTIRVSDPGQAVMGV